MLNKGIHIGPVFISLQVNSSDSPIIAANIKWDDFQSTCFLQRISIFSAMGVIWEGRGTCLYVDQPFCQPRIAGKTEQSAPNEGEGGSNKMNLQPPFKSHFF